MRCWSNWLRLEYGPTTKHQLLYEGFVVTLALGTLRVPVRVQPLMLHGYDWL